MKLPKSQSKIELSKLNVPKPARDVYRELRGQHLLPLVALLIASLIAVPLLFGESPDAQSPPAKAITATSSTAPTLTATTWNPGLRKYQNRLSYRHPSDPFTNGLSAADFNSSSGEAGSGSESSEAAPPEAPEVTQPSESAANESGETPAKSPQESASGENETQTPGSGRTDSGEYAIDVEVTSIQAGRDQSGSVRYHQPQWTKLPNNSVAALTYVGPNSNGTEAMMLVSPQVTALAGSSKCVVPAAPCQLLALALKAPETLVVGPNDVTYRIELLKIGALSERQAPHVDSEGKSGKAAVGQSQAARPR
jgi:hypothetical protein